MEPSRADRVVAELRLLIREYTYTKPNTSTPRCGVCEYEQPDHENGCIMAALQQLVINDLFEPKP